MHEDLLGYLLGALDPDEMQRMERLLERDADLRAELEKIRASLEPLDELGGEDDFEVPVGLTARTLASLPDFDESADLVTPMAAQVESRRGDRMRWLDLACGSIAAAVMLALLLPSLAEGRFRARRTGCADQFRRLHAALTTYANRSSDHRLPAVGQQGPESFAGVYAIRLNEAGLLSDASMRWCPSMDPPDLKAEQQILRRRQLDPLGVPSINELHTAPKSELAQMQRVAGGHYAYSLGVVEQDHYAPPRFESRSSFAVMSDAPQVAVGQDGIADDYLAHGSVGFNVLYEDGSVRFLDATDLSSVPDNPLLNRDGKVAAGVDSEDATLGPSWQSPFQALDISSGISL